jgi:hypothetical protein
MTRCTRILPRLVLHLTPILFGFAALRAEEQRLLYVAAPGVRNYLEYGGAGILVFDIDHGHRFVRRIQTPASRANQPENIKGICASAATARLYYTTPTRLYCQNLMTDEPLWERKLPQGCDRLSILPDGKLLYVPSYERDIWNVVDGGTGEVVATIETNSGAHNTVCGASGRWVYLGGLKSPFLRVAETEQHHVVREVGPFGGAVRPFTIDSGENRAFVCVNDLLGFEIGDLTTGKVTSRIEVTGFRMGPVKRHGCPSHGIALSPDERQIWLCDAHNQRLHVFDMTGQRPRQIDSIALRDEPGWVTFGMDGAFAYSSTGEVIDAERRTIVAALADETGRPVQSEKMLEIRYLEGKLLAVGDQFGVGRLQNR